MVYQTDFKEAKEVKKITNGAKKNKGIAKKLQAKKEKVCSPVKLAKQFIFHNIKVRGVAKARRCKLNKELVKKTIFPQKICFRLVGISVVKKNKSVPSF